MAWKLPTAHIRRQADLCILMATEARSLEESDAWLAAANDWLVELPPEEIEEPGPVIDAEFIDIEP